MRVVAEINLVNFEFWAGAKEWAKMFSYEEMEQIEECLEELKDDWTETEINDLFWFDIEYVCELLGYEFDNEKCEVIR